MSQPEALLSVNDLYVRFNLHGRTLYAIRGISLDVYAGETLAIVGESGCGKSVFCKALTGLLDPGGRIEGGAISYGGEDLASFRDEKDWLRVRGGEIAMVPQDPVTSLNPLRTIGYQVMEAIRRHQGLRGREAKSAAAEALREVGIDTPERRLRQYPHELSGGMCQRVVIAIAMACRPRLLICDEPTTALDVTSQARILELIKSMSEKYRLTVLYVTHDLGVVAGIADRVAVMYAGDLVEIGLCGEVFYDPRHPYTWAMLSSLPQLGLQGESLIPGAPPSLLREVRGDVFAPRNPWALNIDYVERPPFFEVSPTHRARTWLLDPRAPRAEPPEEFRRLRRERGVEE